MTAHGDDYRCGWRETPTGRNCYQPATHAVEELNRHPLNFACELHRLHDQWAHQVKVPYRVISLEQWIAEGRGYRGPSLGSAPTPARPTIKAPDKDSDDLTWPVSESSPGGRPGLARDLE